MTIAKKLFAGISLFAGALFISTTSLAASTVNIQIPTERAIYQRNNENVADMTIQVSYQGTAKLQAQVSEQDIPICDWIDLTKSEEGDTLYKGTLPNIPGGGWYKVTVREVDATTGEELEQTSVDKVGVGEVFITGGQSNSCNFGEQKMEANEDIVSAYNAKKQKWQHCEDSQPNSTGFNTGNEGGSPWPSMGDALVAKTGVPVGFVSTGVGSAKIEELRTQHYYAIKDAIQSLKPYGYRAFLLHQGEADTPTTDRGEYLNSLQTLIAQTREDAGYPLNWMIAQVSYAWKNYNDTAKMESMKETQRAACNEYDIFVGPTTDDLQGEYRREADRLHLSELGLIEHGTRWANMVFDKIISPHKLLLDETVTHGKFAQNEQLLFAGDTITLEAVPEEGYYLKEDSIQINDGAIEVADMSFKMLSGDMTIKAEFVPLPEYFSPLIATIKEMEDTDFSLYVEDEKAQTDFLSTLVEAKKVYANPASTKEEIDAAITKLTSAHAGLTLLPIPTETPVASEVPAPSATPEGSSTPVPSLVPTAAPSTAPTGTVAPTETPSPVSNTESNSKSLKGYCFVKGGLKYTVMADAKSVCVTKLMNAKKTSITIPAIISAKGVTFKVTAIEKKAFYGAKKLKTLKIKSTTITKVGSNAFKNMYKKVKIKIPSSKLTAYRKLFKKKGLPAKAKITK